MAMDPGVQSQVSVASGIRAIQQVPYGTKVPIKKLLLTLFLNPSQNLRLQHRAASVRLWLVTEESCYNDRCV